MADRLFDIKTPLVVGIGEGLFDCFAGRRVLGGAPVNFAVHVHQLLSTAGGQGVAVSRVGNDDDGRNLIEELDNRGIATEWIQRDSSLPTGTVQVELNQLGEPTYQISANVAWEHLEFDESLELLASNCSAVCFGTLAQRCEPSRATIHRFLSKASSAIRLLDVNLRQHFYTPEILAESFAAATDVKLNQDELTVVCTLLDDQVSAPKRSASMLKHTASTLKHTASTLKHTASTLKHTASTLDTTDLMVRKLQESYELDCVALTRGSRGTVLYTKDQRYEAEPIAIQRAADADNVGAGDACAAGLVGGLLLEWPSAQILEVANQMGAFVASRPGATPSLPAELVKSASASS